MIRNQWYIILESKEVPRGKPAGVLRMGEPLVLWRDQAGNLSCMRDLCPHRGVALSAGKLVGDHLQCPFHAFEFDRQGEVRLVPANGRAAHLPKAMRAHTYPTQEAHGFIYLWAHTYPTQEAHGFIYLWWGDPQPEYPSLPWFESIDDDFAYATVKDTWAAHYSRVIENQLDAAHVPFIHRTTIGRGHRTVVNGPISTLESGGLLNMWVNNEIDTGQVAKKASELSAPTGKPSLQFHFPNLWQNWIADNLRALLVFAPIDDEHTRLYLRFYQKIVRAPVLRNLFCAFGSLSNLLIERQDRWVVVTQRPRRSDLRGGEILVPSDGPIILYRKRRDELLSEKPSG
jgi:phenylpropionate dioxygenase-like ring-hydroxylating dioxygenase large terminal subunit